MQSLPREGEHRREERVRAALPVDLGDAHGVTRDVSASGIFFETDAEFAQGSAIQFEIEIETGSGRLVLACMGEVVRLERRDSRLGVGVKIFQSTVKPAGG